MKKALDKKGFTLVEIIVSLAIFSIVAVVALGALVKIISANKKAQTLQSAITNLNYAMESISREMRVGSKYYLDTTPPGSSIGASNAPISLDDIDDVYLSFESPKTAQLGTDTCQLIISYKFSKAGGIEKWRQAECDGFPGSGSYSSTIDDNVMIDGYYLSLDDLSTANAVPVATMRISGHAGVREREKTYFDVQTSISPRVE